jgi:hypothetical protein
MLPSGGALDLDYLDLLDAHWVVDIRRSRTRARGRRRPGASSTTSAHPNAPAEPEAARAAPHARPEKAA